MRPMLSARLPPCHFAAMPALAAGRDQHLAEQPDARAAGRADAVHAPEVPRLAAGGAGLGDAAGHDGDALGSFGTDLEELLLHRDPAAADFQDHPVFTGFAEYGIPCAGAGS